MTPGTPPAHITAPVPSPPPAAGPASAPPAARRAILFFSGGVALLHLLVSLTTPYGFHRDEFLYLAMGRYLRLFAMDFPPFIALLSEVQRGVFGDALWSLRLAPGLAHGALVALTGLLAWRLGGGRRAQLLAMTATATVPLYLRAGSLFQPVVFDQLWWTLALYALVRLCDEASEGRAAARHWWLLGVAGGVGLLTKFSVLLFGAAVLAALLVARRAWLRRREPWLALGVALLIGSPSLAGQIRLGWPVFGQMEALRHVQLDRITYPAFLAEHLLMHGPAALLAMAGALALLAHPRFARWRVVGWACAFAFLIIMLLRGKPYYTGPLFPVLYAAGAVLLAAGVEHARATWRGAPFALLLLWGAVTLPMGLPVLPPEPMARYAAALGVTAAVTTNDGAVLELPQDYADMLGWEEKVAHVAAVYHSLPPRDREDAVIVAANYGQAGAIDLFGPRHGLPPARAPVGSYWFFGPGEKPGRVIVKVGDEREDLEPFLASVHLARRIDQPWLVPEERDLAIWIGYDPVMSLQEAWPLFAGQH